MNNKDMYRGAFSKLCSGHASFEEVVKMKRRPVRMKRSAAVLCCILVLILAMGTIAFAASDGEVFRIFVNGSQTSEQHIEYGNDDEIVVEGDDVRTEMKSSGAEGELEVDDEGDISVEIKKVE